MPGKQGVLGGGAWVLAGEATALPAGLLSAVFLTRELGPDLFGSLALATAITLALSWLSSAIFSLRATVRLISTAAQPGDVAAMIVRWQIAIGAVLGLVLFAAASPVAAWLADARITPLLRIFALEVALFAVARAYHGIATARGMQRRGEAALDRAPRSDRHRRRARLRACRGGCR